MRAPGLARPWDGRLIAGVCAALSEKSGIDVNLIRLAFVLLALAKGIGVLVYLGLWLILPSVGDRSRDLGAVTRSNLGRLGDEIAFTAERLHEGWRGRSAEARLGAVLLLGGGLALLLWTFGAFSWLTPSRLIAVAAIVAGVGLLLSVSGRGYR